MPFVILDALEGKEDVCAPDAIPERKSEDDRSVEVLVRVAAIKGTPVPRGDPLVRPSLLLGHQVFGMLVNAE